MSIPALLTVLMLGLFDVRVNWTDAQHNAVDVFVQHDDSYYEGCLQGGFEISYRFEMEICRRRDGWLDSCGRERTAVHHARRDPISGTYHMRRDLLGDGVPPQTMTTADEEQMREMLFSRVGLPLSHFGREASQPGRRYLSVRIIAECRGASLSMLEQIPWLLTFGSYRGHRPSTGWEDFALD